jgi:hypothetical protein
MKTKHHNDTNQIESNQQSTVDSRQSTVDSRQSTGRTLPAWSFELSIELGIRPTSGIFNPVIHMSFPSTTGDLFLVLLKDFGMTINQQPTTR